MFMTSRRARMAIGVAAVAAMAVAGCSSKSKTSAPASSSPAGSSSPAASASGSASAAWDCGDNGQKITLKIGLFGNFAYKTAGLYDKYQQLCPNITIQEDDIEQSGDYWNKLKTNLAAGSGLDDIQAIEVGFVAQVTANYADKFVDFNTVPNAAQIKSTFYPWKWQMATSTDGKTVGLGTDAGPEAMCFRQDLLKAAGLPNDRNTLAQQWSTWDGFINFGKQYKQKTGKAFIDSVNSIFNAAVYQGNEAYDNAQGKPDVENSDGVKKAWQLAVQAAQAGITAKINQWTKDWNQSFASGTFATISCPAWMLAYITSQAGDAGKGKWDVTSLPGGAANWGGSWLGVPKGGPHEKAAIALATWLTAPAQQLTMWTSQHFWPSSQAAAQDPSVKTATSDYFNNAPIGEIFGNSAANLKMPPIGPYDTDIQTALDTELGNVEQQGKNPQQAWNDALAKIKQVTGS
ncbi:MAG: extracellular solute-binding protein [Acidothermus sp.]|nr:extracellular solute-binding protein [Acidothermus sp.]